MTTQAHPGRLITFEGGEGTGKTTQIRRLAEYWRGQGRVVVTTREPGGTQGAERIRDLLVKGVPGQWDGVSEALLFYAARHDHWRRVIAPALESGAVVLCDRFADSTMAYQGYGHNMDRDWIAALHRLVMPDAKVDLTIILDLPAELALARSRGPELLEDRFELMEIEFHQRLRQGYLEIARQNPARCVVLDASPALDAVEAAICAVVHARWPQEGLA
ncbi:MAG: dTMP kinase [Alphaproteobacteria bacterium]|nr:MAG: dTMP kinase [Alphaproteobacteria bacterium]